MAREGTAIVASALLLSLAVFLSLDAGVEGWCLEYPAPDPNACRGKGGLLTCRDKCLAVGQGFAGGECNKGVCFCLKCADQPPPPNAL